MRIRASTDNWKDRQTEYISTQSIVFKGIKNVKKKKKSSTSSSEKWVGEKISMQANIE